MAAMIPRAQRQSKWEDAPEMAVASPRSQSQNQNRGSSRQMRLMRNMERSAEMELETELDVEAGEQLLVPRLLEQRGSSRGVLPLAATVLLLGCIAAYFYTQRPVEVKQEGRVSMVVYGVGSPGESTLAQQALKGQPFIYVTDASAFHAGDAVILGQGSDKEEVNEIEEVHEDTGALRFQYGLQNSHEEKTVAKASEFTPELKKQQEAHPQFLYTRFTANMAFGGTTDDTKVRLNDKCYQFESGDEVEFSSKQRGHYEFNMITGITFEEDGTCFCHLAYPLAFDHVINGDLSKMVHPNFQTRGTPAPVPLIPAVVKDFATLDTDGDGKISKQEALAEPELAARFPGVDKDGDGSLSESEFSDFSTLDLDGDGLVSLEEAANDLFVKDNFPSWDKDGDDKVSHQELELAALDTDGDGRISKKEALPYSELAARLPGLDTDGSGALSSSEFAGFDTLDADGDGFISSEEAAKDDYLSGKFPEWDADGDGKLSQQDLETAALGSPQLVFDIKNVIYAKFAADKELFESKRKRAEKVIADDLDNVYEGQVMVKMTKGYSLRVNAYIDGDARQAEGRREQIQMDLDKLFKEDPTMAPYLRGKDFDSLDVDGDGEISMKEALAFPEVAARLPSLDTDGDGVLSESEFAGFATLDTDGDGFIESEEGAKDGYVGDRFPKWDTDGDGKLSDEELEFAALDTNADGRISQKEALAHPEVAARLPSLDTDGSGALSKTELAGFDTLDSDYDGSIDSEEGATDDYVNEHFPEWDTNGDDKLSDQELDVAALGKPEASFNIKDVNYKKFSADKELFESKRKQAEKTIADDLDKVDRGQVFANLTKGHSLRVDAYIDGDASEAEERREQIQADLDKLFKEDPAMAPYLRGKDFSSLDTNDDGEISKKEALAYPEVAARLPSLDTDGDGVLSESEFAGFATLDSNGDGVIFSEEAAKDGYVSDKFPTWDTDFDGKLSDEELAFAAMDTSADGEISKKEAMAYPEVAARLPSLDTNGTGSLSKPEFAGFATLDLDGDGFLASAEGAKDGYVSDKFPKWDTNGDGKLSDEELKFAALDTDLDGEISKKEALAYPEVAARLPSLDTDGDGVLSKPEFAGFNTTDSDSDGFITSEEGAKDVYMGNWFPKWDRDGDGKLSDEELEFAALDTNGDKRISKKEALAHPELAARLPSLDKDDSGALSKPELAGFDTLDSDGDGSVGSEEGAKDAYVKDNFPTWDTDGDDKLSDQELEAAALGSPLFSFDIKDVDYKKFSADKPLFEKKRKQAEQVIAIDLDKVDKGHVMVTMSEGKTLRVDAYIDGDAGQVEDRRGQIEADLAKLFKGDPSMAPYVRDGEPSDFDSLDTNRDGKISKKEALAYPEVAARIPDMDTNGDGALSKPEFAAPAAAAQGAGGANGTTGPHGADESGGNHGGSPDFATLDSDGDAFIAPEEAAKDDYADKQFPVWDQNGDDMISQEELKAAALGKPQASFDVKDVDYAKFSANTDLVNLKRQQSEEVIARDLDKIDEGEVMVEFSAGDSLRVDAYIDGDTNQVEPRREQIEDDLAKLFAGDPAMAPYFEKNFGTLDADGDGKISKKEALAEPELAARLPELDKDGDGALSESEFGGFDTLDSDGDGFIAAREGKKDGYVDDKFPKWDNNGDDKLSDQELEDAALGTPQVVFIVKPIDYERFHADSELWESKRKEAEKVIAGDLDDIDEGQVMVKMSEGGSDVSDRSLRDADAGQVTAQPPAGGSKSSVRVDAFIDGDASQVEGRRKQIEADLLKIFNDDPAMTPYVDGPMTAASMAQTKPVESKGPSLSLLLALLAGFLAILALCCFCCCRKAPRSKWEDNLPDAIVVPGGGLSKEGKLLPWVQERLRVAKQIYDEVNEVRAKEGKDKATIIPMCEGIRYTPRDPRGSTVRLLESQQAAQYLMDQGVAYNDIIADDLSLDTVGNAYFLRTTHSNAFLARTLVIVTSEFHMSRCKLVFNKIFKLGPFPKGFTGYKLIFHEVENVGIQVKALNRRQEWEQKQLARFQIDAAAWNDLHDVHSAIFSDDADQAPDTTRRRESLPRSFSRSKEETAARTGDSRLTTSRNR